MGQIKGGAMMKNIDGDDNIEDVSKEKEKEKTCKNSRSCPSWLVVLLLISLVFKAALLLHLALSYKAREIFNSEPLQRKNAEESQDRLPTVINGVPRGESLDELSKLNIYLVEGFPPGRNIDEILGPGGKIHLSRSSSSSSSSSFSSSSSSFYSSSSSSSSSSTVKSFNPISSSFPFDSTFPSRLRPEDQNGKFLWKRSLEVPKVHDQGKLEETGRRFPDTGGDAQESDITEKDVGEGDGSEGKAVFSNMEGENNCGNPPVVDHALVVLSNVTYGYASCKPGFTSENGDVRMALKCVNSHWYIVDSRGDTVPPICLPINIDQSYCQNTPKVENGRVSFLSANEAEFICKDGYAIPPLWIQRSKLLCQDDKWIMNSTLQWKCLPKPFNSPCGNIQVLHGIGTISNLTQGHVECTTGYTSTAGRERTQARCIDDQWHYDFVDEGQSMECLPDIKCKGTPLPELTSGQVFNFSGVEGRCIQGYQFPSGDSAFLYACSEGVWTLPSSQRAGCMPFCPNACLNGGTCVPPNTCTCPKGFTGKHCDEVSEEHTEEDYEEESEEVKLQSSNGSKAVGSKEPEGAEKTKGKQGTKTLKELLFTRIDEGDDMTYKLQEFLPDEGIEDNHSVNGKSSKSVGSTKENSNTALGTSTLLSPNSPLMNPEDILSTNVAATLLQGSLLYSLSNMNHRFNPPLRTIEEFISGKESSNFELSVHDDLHQYKEAETSFARKLVAETSQDVSISGSDKFLQRSRRQANNSLDTDNISEARSKKDQSHRNRLRKRQAPEYRFGEHQDPDAQDGLINYQDLEDIYDLISENIENKNQAPEKNEDEYQVFRQSESDGPVLIIDQTMRSSLLDSCAGSGKLPFVKYASVISDKDVVIIACIEGRMFPSGVKSVTLTCKDHNWVIPEEMGNATECIEERTCREPCQNGGTCLPGGKCACEVDFEGEFCELKQCSTLPIVVYNAAIKVSKTAPVVTCHQGYTFDGGESELKFLCEQGDWIIPEGYENVTEITCTADCDPPCTNGGKCIEPNVCRCPWNYTGEACQVIKCVSAPPHVKNAIIEYGPVVSKAVCLEGYHFSGGNTTLDIECKDGEWVPNFCEDGLDPKLECQPLCSHECLNGGKCVAPETCACLMPYDGPDCTELRDHQCHVSPPMVKGAYMNYTVTIGDANCALGHALITGETSIKFVCSHGHWKFSMKDLECKPVCVGGCLNGGNCVDVNQCECIKPYTGQLCQDVASDVCPNPPAPVPNSITHMSPRGVLVTCQAGYAFPIGNTQMELWCNNHRWVPATYIDSKGLPILQDDDEKNDDMPLACFPTCRPACQNEGKCVDVNTCQCQEPYTGDFCQDLSPKLCWDDPPIIEDAQVQYNSTTAIVKCNWGYFLDSLDDTHELSCYKGQWRVSADEKLPKCVPICAPPCDKGGTCVGPNECSCRPGYYGRLCQEKRCSSVPSAIKNSFVFVEISGKAYLSCFSGYIMNNGVHKVLMECKYDKWLTKEKVPREVKDLECRPFCSLPCIHGGNCTAPNLCECTDDFAGRFCQHPRCKDTLINDPRAINTTSPDQMKAVVSCQDGYLLSTAHSELEFECINSQWIAPDAIYSTGKITCVPYCPKGCANGGKCVASNTCQCPEGFTGSTCTKRYSKTVKGNYCVFPFLYNGTWFEGCTTVDSQRPWCATEVTIHGFISRWDICIADLGHHKVVMSDKGRMCSFPFIHEGQKQYGCITSDGKKEPWCALEVDMHGEVVECTKCELDWGVLSVMITIDGRECQFPFIHGGKVYKHCVDDTKQADVHPWCATETSVEGTPLATATCKLDWGVHKVIRTHNNRVCIFPFEWKNHTAYSCLPGEPNRGGPWCATKIDKKRRILEWDVCYVQEERIRSYPPGARLLEPPIAGTIYMANITTVRGLPCKTPFVYKGQKHSGCVKEGFGQPWCAIKVDKDRNVISTDQCDNKWDVRPGPMLPDSPNNHNKVTIPLLHSSKGKVCVIPFFYKGIQYHGCIKVGSTQPFCAVKVDMQENATLVEYCPADWDKHEPSHTLPNMQNIFETARPAPSLLVTAVTGEKCIFPFTLDDVEYTGCITMGSMGPFCPIKVGHKGEVIDIAFCPKNWLPKSHKNVKTESGIPCRFPFMYKGVLYSGCIQTGRGKPFCATEVDLDQVATHIETCTTNDNSSLSHALGSTSMTVNKVNKVIRTESGEKCEFPFIFNGIEYTSCATIGTMGPICATKVDHNKVAVSTGHCINEEDPQRNTHKSVTTVSGEHCKNPFIYHGIEYSGCITMESNGPFCAIEIDHTNIATKTSQCDPHWRRFIYSDVPGNVPIVETVKGKRCLFPFIYNKIEYYGCIKKGDEGPFCATSVGHGNKAIDIDTCKEDWESPAKQQADEMPTVVTTTGEPCQIPFTHGNTEYYGCATMDSDHPYCATEVDYNRELLNRGYCDNNWDKIPGNPFPGEMPVLKTSSGQTCIIPFVERGISYYGCVTIGSKAPYCAVQVDQQRNVVTKGKCHQDWNAAINTNRVIKTVSGKTCILPFTFDGITTIGCVSTEETPKPFCVTEVDNFGQPTETDYCSLRWENSVPLYPGGSTNTGNKCVFPFSSGGKLHHTCTFHKSFRPWCATGVDSNLNPTHWGYCVVDRHPTKGHPEKMTAGKSIHPSIGHLQHGGNRQPGIMEHGPHIDTFGVGPSNIFAGSPNIIPVGGPSNLHVGSSSNLHMGGSNNLPVGSPSSPSVVGLSNIPIGSPSNPIDSGLTNLPGSGPSSLLGSGTHNPPGGGLGSYLDNPTAGNIMTTSGKRCVFPFLWQGRPYHNCISTKDGKPWCATSVDSSGEALRTSQCAINGASLSDKQIGVGCTKAHCLPRVNSP